MAPTPPSLSPSRSAAQANSNDTMGSQLLEENARDITLSPADCRTIEKILHDVRSPPPLSPTPYSRDGQTRSLDAEVLGTNNMYPRDAGQDMYAIGCYRHGDEREDGYEDEDDSMELSDVDGVPGHGHDEKDGDTVEEVMNLPGKTAPAVSVQDFGAFYTRDEPMSDEARETKEHRERIEEDLRRQVLIQDDDCEVDATVGDTEQYTDTNVADVKGSRDNDTEVVQALQEDTFMHSLQEEEADVSALEVSSPQLEATKEITNGTPVLGTGHRLLSPFNSIPKPRPPSL